MSKNIICVFVLILAFSVMNCFSHRYILSNRTEASFEPERLHYEHFFLLGLIPSEKVISADKYCAAGQSIYSVNLYDSMLDGFVCGGSFLLYCPHTIAVRCIDDERIGAKQ